MDEDHDAGGLMRLRQVDVEPVPWRVAIGDAQAAVSGVVDDHIGAGRRGAADERRAQDEPGENGQDEWRRFYA
jgi:hypothetical protein